MAARKFLILITTAAALSAVGYWKRDLIVPMLWPHLAPHYEQIKAKALPTPKSCTYGKSEGCMPDETCAFVAPETAECVKKYVGPTPFIRFPFNPEDEVVCAKGPKTSPGTPHSYVNALYAIDLATPDPKELGATVFAGMDGTAFVHRGCRDEPEDKLDPCGAGFGNHVRIMNPDGYMVLYAHLSSVFIDDGAPVKRGTEIGREGSSGAAGGIRHLHFSVHHAKVESFIEAVSFYRGQVGATPPSIPFETQFCDPDRAKECHRMRVRMDQIPCDGKTQLEADWRD